MRGLGQKVAIVTGGGSGIGAATARRLAAEGASVVVSDIVADSATAVATSIADGGGKAVGFACDISKDAAVADLVGFAVKTYGGLDLLHANAADMTAILSDTDALTVPLEIFDQTIAVNIRGHLLCTRHALPEMQKRGGGALVYTTSAAAYVGEPERVSYGISKSGINALVRHIASRWGKENIRANAVAPCLVITEKMRTTMPKEFMDFALSITRSARLGQPDDIAATVAFLMSKDAEWINGQVISVDGGATLR